MSRIMPVENECDLKRGWPEEYCEQDPAISSLLALNAVEFCDRCIWRGFSVQQEVCICPADESLPSGRVLGYGLSPEASSSQSWAGTA